MTNENQQETPAGEPAADPIPAQPLEPAADPIPAEPEPTIALREQLAAVSAAHADLMREAREVIISALGSTDPAPTLRGFLKKLG